MAELKLRRVKRTDWEWICRWFKDETLDHALGPMDSEWLTHVLNDRDGVQLVAVDDGPVGLAGVVWATTEHPFHCITDLAIDPARKRKGFGRRVLDAILEWPEHPTATQWVAYVEPSNLPPARLLAAAGWTLDGQTERGLNRFVLAK